ncbi:putative iron-regulated membrane protein [Pedobacter sp. CAN_A7]|uniref:PepSY-associated TM helix domain-containing protein n=1 Tax=Pedobacter sp. CAN_A7 TaxID=2787722 RepID=UPI0018CA57E7
MNNNLSAWEKTRKFFNDVHLWLGLGSGIIVFLVCLSGTIYTFNTEIREAATPELYKVQYQAGLRAKPADELISAVAAASGFPVVSVKVPADLNRTWQLGVRMKEGARPTTFFVNPYTAAVVGNSADINSGTITFMTYMFSLHRWLLLDKVEEPIFGELENRKLGSYISGGATILFTIGVITGMVIWFPRKLRAWKQGFKIKWKGSWKRTNHDLHNSLGLYACIFLLLMGLTGPQWSFEWYRTGLRKTLGTYKPEDAKGGKGGPGKGERGKGEGGKGEGGRGGRSDGRDKPTEEGLAEASAPALPFAEYERVANEVFKYKGDYVVSLPSKADAPVNISKFKAGFFAPAAADRLTLDPKGKEKIKVERFADMPLNERISASIKALHVGDVYGMFTKIIYFLACLIATSLPVTGTLIWLNKMKKKPARKAVTGNKNKLEPQTI